MKAEEITVEVNAKLSVSKETAEACLKLVELYLNDNKDSNLVCTCGLDGFRKIVLTDGKKMRGETNEL